MQICVDTPQGTKIVWVHPGTTAAQLEMKIRAKLSGDVGDFRMRRGSVRISGGTTMSQAGVTEGSRVVAMGWLRGGASKVSAQDLKAAVSTLGYIPYLFM